MTRVLVVGSGGREHALAWTLRRSAGVSEVFVAPGNGGTQANVSAGAGDLDALVALAKERADVVVVGPEDPLARGLVDMLDAAGIPAFGPSRACAHLEASKAYAKQVMDAAGVPTARWGRFTDHAEARAWLKAAPFPVVVKASGLAAGKGVVVPDSKDEALAALDDIMDGRFGDAGAEVVLEERLQGEEVSLLAFCDGLTAVVMPPAQDHKRIGEGDTGPNTGGMGAYAPAPAAANQAEALADLAIRPVLAHLAAQGTPYKGVLYAGLMLTPSGPKVLEYNCRFGDPETQVLLPLLATDLLDVVMACIRGTLASTPIAWHPGAAATVVCAAAGYPASARKGDVIEGVSAASALEGVTVFHAGTRAEDGALRTAGGRVLAVTGRGATLRDALDRAYAGVDQIHFPGKQVRRDIGWRALQGAKA